MKLNPTHGDVLVLKPNSLYHCTRQLQAWKKQLGIAFFQKSSLFRELHKLRDEKMIEIYDTWEKRKFEVNIEQYEARREVYIKERDAGHYSLSML